MDGLPTIQSTTDVDQVLTRWHIIDPTEREHARKVLRAHSLLREVNSHYTCFFWLMVLSVFALAAELMAMPICNVSFVLLAGTGICIVVFGQRFGSAAWNHRKLRDAYDEEHGAFQEAYPRAVLIEHLFLSPREQFVQWLSDRRVDELERDSIERLNQIVSRWKWTFGLVLLAVVGAVFVIGVNLMPDAEALQAKLAANPRGKDPPTIPVAALLVCIILAAFGTYSLVRPVFEQWLQQEMEVTLREVEALDTRSRIRSLFRNWWGLAPMKG